MWYLNEENDLAVCQLLRCGNKCIRGWLGQRTKVVPNDYSGLMEISRRVAFVRHPLERLKSTYWLFYWMLVNDGVHHISNTPVETWEIFIDHVLDESTPYDEHVKPQVHCIAGTANIYHRYENLAEKFELYMPGILPDRGRTTKLAVNTGYRLAEVIKVFAEDLAVWMESN